MTSVRPKPRSSQPGRPAATHYSVLGVPPASSLEKIKDTYYRLTRATHPDLHPGDLANEERFKDITLAWGVLRDAERRKEYDARLLLEGRFSCVTCGGKGLRAGFLGRKFQKDILCEGCDGTGEQK